MHFGGHFLGRSGHSGHLEHFFKSGLSLQVGWVFVVSAAGQYHSVSQVGHSSQQQPVFGLGVVVVVLYGT